MKSCIVVFPLYKKPSSLELSFLENGMRLTKGFQHCIVAPDDLVIDSSFGALSELQVTRFNPQYFQSIKGYNQLLLSQQFYQTFIAFDFILLHQADVYLFSDQLEEWCNKDFDYIGAPWFRPDKLKSKSIKNLLKQAWKSFKKKSIYDLRHNQVGNGGLSLRKVSIAIQILDQVNPDLIKPYLENSGPEYNEDIFWSLVAQSVASFRKPSLDLALQFAFEFNAAKAFEYNHQQLPFGCHAPLKHDVSFWRHHIPELTKFD